MNKITVNFLTCDPLPPGGYEIMYRVEGSGGSYIHAGNFFTSPAIFYDTVNPAGTCYEGYIRSDCGDHFSLPIYWTSCDSVVVGDNSSCGTTLSTETTDPGYVDLGNFIIHVDGAVEVTLAWEVFDRPNRFVLKEDGLNINSTGWKGIADYPGPWGMSLSTAVSGTIEFNPIPGKEYSIGIEAGPGDPDNPLTDNFNINISCT